MEDLLSGLGNVAAVPIVITLTQLIKRNVNWKRGPELIALGVSLVLCFGWRLYDMSQADLDILILSGPLGIFKWVIYTMVVGFATWLSASKLYDLGYGEKKTQQKFEEISKQKEALHNEIRRLSSPSVNEEGGDGVVDKDPNLSDKLEDILEGRG